MAREIRKVHIDVSSNVSTQMTKGTAAATGLSGALKGVGASANLATGGIRAMTMALISSGVGILVVGLGALVAGLGGVINKSREFSKSLSGLKAVLGRDADPLDIKALSQDAKNLGASTAFTATQVVQLQTELAKLGFTTDQILNATGATLALAAATGTDLAEAATVAGATLRGFGLKASQTQMVVDVMAKSFSSSSLDMSKFTESMKMVAPIASTLKIPIQEATAALGILADRGISGSLAGNQLKRVMSDLAIKTGVSFRDSLTITSEKLKAATSDSEKLAIAKALVGDRAKGSLIALAENADALDTLTIALQGAGGAAQEMADERLDNLDGDLTKLSSAWDGFILAIEDGEGVLSGIARGAIQLFTGSVQLMQQGLRDGAAIWRFLVGQFDAAGPRLQATGAYFTTLSLKAQKAFQEMKLAAAGVPIIGDNIDKEQARKNLADIESRLQDANVLVKTYMAEANEITKEAENDAWRIRAGINENGRTQEQEDALVAAAEFRARKLKEGEAATAKALADKKLFLEKLKKLEQDTDDTTALEKIDRKRKRHLAELATLKMTTAERRDAEKAINDIYDIKEADQKVKNLKAFNDKFGDGGMSPLDKIQAKREEHLLALDALEIEETEKAELKKRIKEHYDGLVTEVNTAQGIKDDAKNAKDIAEAERVAEAKRQALYSVLDSAADVAGRETAIGRGLLAMKLALQLKELAMKMGFIKQELVAKGQKAMVEANIEGAKIGTATASGMAETSKVGFPWNVITMAGYALQAASLVKSFAGQKKKLKAITGVSGGNNGGGAAPVSTPPSFNVLGQTSAGDNMIANTVASVNDNPMRAYVVADDVTTSQGIRRNTEAMASVG